jgi:2-furoate---CoA ligase
VNLRECFGAAVQRAPHALALVDTDVRWTYAELAQEVYAVARGLQDCGLHSGDRVMTILRNRRELVVIFWACQWLGLVCVPLDPRLSLSDITYCIEDAEPELLVFDAACVGTLRLLYEQGLLPQRLYTVGSIRSTGSLAQASRDFAQLRYETLVSSEPVALSDDAIAVMLYSSGSTGRPKGVPRSHSNEISATLAHMLHNCYQFGESTVALSSFCHTMGLRMLLAMLMLNGKLVIVPDDMPETCITWIADEQVSCLYAFPSVYHDLLPGFVNKHISSVRKLAYAGDAMTTELIAQYYRHVAPTVFVNHFGSTEIYTYTICSWLERKPGCAGKAGIFTELRLIPPSAASASVVDDVVPAGEVGELLVRLTSPEAFRGYWNRPDLTSRVIQQGWYCTGDLVRLDEDGDLWVVGRVDDMVISSGEKVYPAEVEAILRTHAGVQEVVVMGIPDARAGKLLAAFVVPADPTLTAHDLEVFCASHPQLATFKRPAKFVLLEHMPRRAHKIVRQELLQFI